MPRRIAIVEDDPVIRANTAEALNKYGYEVVQHANRPEALAAMRTRLPDLALLDIGLGDEIDGGFALCRELRAMSGTLPIIFLTARDSDFDTVCRRVCRTRRRRPQPARNHTHTHGRSDAPRTGRAQRRTHAV